MKEAANTSETSVNFYQAIRRNIAKDWHFRIYSFVLMMIMNIISIFLSSRRCRTVWFGYKALPLLCRWFWLESYRVIGQSECRFCFCVRLSGECRGRCYSAGYVQPNPYSANVSFLSRRLEKCCNAVVSE
jgi:hypothetical protein